jgi:hypothetical protein
MVRQPKKIFMLLLIAMAGGAWIKYQRMSETEKKQWKQKWNTWLNNKWQQAREWM